MAAGCKSAPKCGSGLNGCRKTLKLKAVSMEIMDSSCLDLLSNDSFRRELDGVRLSYPVLTGSFTSFHT